MDLREFRNSLSHHSPPSGISKYLEAMWYDGKNDWAKAHEIIQDIETNIASWIHAYLHRKEGDIWNSDYWYRKAQRSRPSYSLENEWSEIVGALLQN